MEMAVFYSKEKQYGAEPCFVSAKQSFETVVANSRSETLDIPCKPPNLHASCDAAGFLNPFAQRLLSYNETVPRWRKARRSKWPRAIWFS